MPELHTRLWHGAVKVEEMASTFLSSRVNFKNKSAHSSFQAMKRVCFQKWPYILVENVFVYASDMIWDIIKYFPFNVFFFFLRTVWFVCCLETKKLFGGASIQNTEELTHTYTHTCNHTQQVVSLLVFSIDCRDRPAELHNIQSVTSQ